MIIFLRFFNLCLMTKFRGDFIKLLKFFIIIHFFFIQILVKF